MVETEAVKFGHVAGVGLQYKEIEEVTEVKVD